MGVVFAKDEIVFYRSEPALRKRSSRLFSNSFDFHHLTDCARKLPTSSNVAGGLISPKKRAVLMVSLKNVWVGDVYGQFYHVLKRHAIGMLENELG